MVKRGVPENILQNAVQKRSNCPLDCAPLGLTARPNLVALDSSYLLAWISLVKLGFLYSSYIRWIFSFFPFLQSIKSEHMHTSQHLVDHWQWSRSPELSMKSHHTQSAPSIRPLGAQSSSSFFPSLAYMDELGRIIRIEHNTAHQPTPGVLLVFSILYLNFVIRLFFYSLYLWNSYENISFCSIFDPTGSFSLF